MAEGYTSWTCADLGGATLYSSDTIVNPNWSTAGDFCPLVRPYGFNIMALYEDAIADAKAAGQDYDSGDIKLARVHAYGELSDNYIMIRINYNYNDGSNDTLVIRLGSTTGGYSTTMTFDYDNFTTFEEYQKSIFIVRNLTRDTYLRYENLPGYTGECTYYVFLGWFVYMYIGTWEDPGPGHMYGRMNYTEIGHGDPSACLLSIPCAANNEESMREQSEGVFRASRLYSNHAAGTDFYICGVDGNVDFNPENPRKPDPNEEDEGGESKPGGGDGDHRQPYTPIPIPGIPTIGPNSAGFVYMLRMTPAQMQQFAVDLVRPTWWTALKNFFADPLDFICGIMIVPYEPVSNYSVYPKFGDNVFEHAYPQVYQQYTVIDCGSLAVSKYFGGALDQNPFTKLLVWLPYIGYRELDADECMDKTLHIVYHCDCLTGDCVCFISTVAGSGYEVPFDRVIAQFSGNCGVRVPFGATSFDAAIAASVQLLGGAVGAIAGGAMGAAIGAGAITESQIANSVAGTTVGAVQGSKVTTERSGVSGACAGYLSIQYPYLLREVPRQSLAKNYMDLEGYPSNVAGPLSKFYGYAAVESIDLNGINATKEELDEIRSILAGGVYL